MLHYEIIETIFIFREENELLTQKTQELQDTINELRDEKTEQVSLSLSHSIVFPDICY